MALYWRLKSVPELAELSKSERRRAMKWASEKAGKDGRLTIPWVLAFMPAFAALVITHLCGWIDVYDDFPSWDIAYAMVLFIGLFWLGFFLTTPFLISRCRAYLREYLTSGV